MKETDLTKKQIITRRRVLLGAGGIVGASALGLGGYIGYSFSERFNREGQFVVPDHRILLPNHYPKMVIASGLNPALNVRGAVDRMGGMKQFVNRGDVVVIKPNIGWERTPVQGINTHPEVVAELVRLCLEEKPKRVIVCDCPVSKNSRKSFVMSGIEQAASKAGAEIITPEDSEYRTVTISERLGAWDILDPFVLATKIINVPVAKHHSLSGITAGMKNWIGITTKLRMQFHGDIQRSIAELANMMRPTLTVMDATRVLMDQGPEGGSVDDVKPTHTVAASVDPVAIDAWAGSLLGMVGDDLQEYIFLAEKMGLGVSDYKAIGAVTIKTNS